MLGGRLETGRTRVSQQAGMLQLTRRRADQLFDDMRRQTFVETDRLFALLMALQWVFGVVLALVAAPRAWTGSPSPHDYLWTAILMGGAISALPIALAVARPGRA